MMDSELTVQHMAPEYTVVCTVAANKVVKGITVSNDVTAKDPACIIVT